MAELREAGTRIGWDGNYVPELGGNGGSRT